MISNVTTTLDEGRLDGILAGIIMQRKIIYFGANKEKCQLMIERLVCKSDVLSERNPVY
jgi:hypothetical protein